VALYVWDKRLRGIGVEQLCLALPVQPGKMQALKEFVQTITESRWAEYEEAQKRYRVQKAIWCLQSSPHGDQFLAYNEGEDLARLFSEFAVSTNHFDVWFRQNLLEITGVDLSKFEPSRLPALLLKYGY
jgi:hypothetical protein